MAAISGKVSGGVMEEKKANWRKAMASMSFSEKIKILEKLRQRSLAIAHSDLRPGKTKRPVPEGIQRSDAN
jgi:hypothetical protein